MEWKVSNQLIDYQQALQFMDQTVAEIINSEAKDVVWLLEHPPIYTAGVSARESDLKDKDFLPVYKTGRGGQYTYHGPGMQIAYVMMNLKKQKFGCDLKKYICNLEQWLINSLDYFGIKGERRAGRVGIWVKTGGSEAKIAAIGVRVRKWVTFHGISLNLHPNLENFKAIVPCGIADYGVTSMAELGIKPTKEELREVLKDEFIKIFN